MGDGNLSNSNGRAIRLRISCDVKYPELIKRITKALNIVLPKNKVSLVYRKGNCIDISCYSNVFGVVLPWSYINGPKYTQNIRIPSWIMADQEFSILCLKGLIESDGSIYMDRTYQAVNFRTVNKSLAIDVQSIFTTLGFKSHLYTNIKTKRIPCYTVRLAKDVTEFIKKTKVNKC